MTSSRSAYETRDGKTVCIDDEIPFDIPDSWAWARLGTVCDAQLGKMLDKAKNVGAPYKYLANANVRWGSFDYSDIRETLFTPEEVEKFELRKGDVVMCEGGVPGRCAVWQSEVADMKFQKAVHRLRSSVLTPLLIQNFFAYAVSADWFEAKLTGTTIKHLPREALVSILIPIPPLAEQKRIVSKIEEVRGMVGLIMRT